MRNHARPSWCSYSAENRLVLDSPRLGSFSSLVRAALLSVNSAISAAIKAALAFGPAMPGKLDTEGNH
jgi:hypothetical protein